MVSMAHSKQKPDYSILEKTLPYLHMYENVLASIEKLITEKVHKEGTNGITRLSSEWKSFETVLPNSHNSMKDFLEVGVLCGECKGVGSVSEWTPAGNIWIKCPYCNGGLVSKTEVLPQL